MKQKSEGPTEARILQVTNDVSEDMCTAKRDELLAVIKWWTGKYAEATAELAKVKSKSDLSKAHQEAMRAVLRRIIALDSDGECNQEDKHWHQLWHKEIMEAKVIVRLGELIEGK